MKGKLLLYDISMHFILEWNIGLSGDLYVTPVTSSFTLVLTFDQEVNLQLQQYFGDASSNDQK